MRWTLTPKPPADKVAHLSESLQIQPVLAGLLVQRGIETFDQAKQFFRPQWEHLHDPFLMKDMDQAVARIERALTEGERILIYGDYDVDGTTSVALIYSYLSTLHEQVATYIPDRYSEGYGVSLQGIDYAHDNDCALIIALDCGIKALKQVDYARERGIDFIICDHHRPGDQLPEAVAVLDPKRSDCDYPYKELCGCGVGFKLVQALSKSRDNSFEALAPYLDLVATAIGADIVPITGENRVLAYYGLQIINTQPRPGIQALIHSSQKTVQTITDVVFIVAPRINAAGRMKHGNYAVSLLIESDVEKAQQAAQEIEAFNADRKSTDQEITKEALEQIETLEEQERATTVVFQPDWHKGVIGIVASRLIETYYRPTVVVTQSGDVLAASVRSVRGFDVYQALQQCESHLLQFGGHKYAAGLTLLPENYQAFKAAFEQLVDRTLDASLRSPEVPIDQELQLTEISPKFYRILKQFAPFGPGNMRPVFLSQGLRDTGWGKCVGADQSHLRLTLQQGQSQPFVAIGFGLGEKKDIACSGQEFKAVYSVDENHWQGQVSLQLKLKDIRN